MPAQQKDKRCMLQPSLGTRIHCLPGGFLHRASWGPPALISSAASQLAIATLRFWGGLLMLELI